MARDPNTPPPLPGEAAPKRRRGLLIAGLVTAGVLLLGTLVYLSVKAVMDSGITRGPDAMFGEQHLKTAVALIELHKVRYGRYPDTLGDLKFTGQWDQLALKSVGYYPNADRTAYYVEVERGVIGKPDVRVPEEFWQGTGYSPSLKPK